MKRLTFPENQQMNIVDAQREIRFRFSGGFYGQAVSGLIWLFSAIIASISSPQTAICFVVGGGFFIFPITELLIRTVGTRSGLDNRNLLSQLGMQVAFVLPFSMPILLPVTQYNLNLFYPALMILLGSHYLPFVFLYGMRMFAALAAFLIGGGVIIAIYLSSSFSLGAWYTGTILLIFAAVGKTLVHQERQKQCSLSSPEFIDESNL
ncbi:MAG: hypothetical protein U0798_04495 [Gemmataceae bacterium]